MFGADVSTNVLIRPSVRITYPWKVKIGDWSWIGDDAVLYSLGNIEIGDHVVISQRSYLCAAQHDHKVETFDMVEKKIVVMSEVWIAADVFVAPGVTIGTGAVIGARSAVFNNMPMKMVCFGSPAKPVSPRVKM